MEKIAGDLLGTILAQTALVGSQLEKGDLLAPYIVVGNDKSVLFFEGETQQQAIDKGEIKTAEFTKQSQAWAYTHEGLITLQNNQKQDIYVFKVWVTGMSQPLQAYQMINPSPFKLIDNIKLMNYLETGLDKDAYGDFLNGLNAAIDANKETAKNWGLWSQAVK